MSKKILRYSMSLVCIVALLAMQVSAGESSKRVGDYTLSVDCTGYVSNHSVVTHNNLTYPMAKGVVWFDHNGLTYIEEAVGTSYRSYWNATYRNTGRRRIKVASTVAYGNEVNAQP